LPTRDRHTATVRHADVAGSRTVDDADVAGRGDIRSPDPCYFSCSDLPARWNSTGPSAS